MLLPLEFENLKDKKTTLIYIFHQHEKYVHSYIIQLLVIHSYNRLKFKINTHISMLNLVTLNYSIEIFVEIWPIDIPNLNNLHPLIQ